ncbi:MAG: crossover junction endodeoxyribonuclease RuvC [Bacteroidia bacterium]|nr:crossover junction endodeoxyribonuclease RuvC [Bacteroidia bacterium]
MTTKETNTIVLGVDPGTQITGYAVAAMKANSLELITIGVLHLEKTEQSDYEKFGTLFEQLNNIIQQFQPHYFAIESPFYGKNIQTLLKLGRVQGIAMATALQHKLPIFEYAPRKIKQSVTGNGNTTKEQVAFVLQKLFGNQFPTEKLLLDATDALAVAVCHLFQYQTEKTLNPKTSSRKPKANSNWENFVKENPSRIT